MKIAQPIGVKIDVLRFIFQDERANFFEHAIAGLPVEQTIVSRPHELGDDEDLNFKLEAERTPGQSENGMCPVMPDGSAAEPRHQTFQQPRVLLFFSNEKLERLVIGGVIWDLRFGLGKKESTLATFAKLKMGQRMSKQALHPCIEWRRQVPLRFRPIELVVLIIMQPLQ